VNKGIAGNSSRDLISRVDADVIAHRPDVVIILVGTNDMLNSKKFISYSEFRDNYTTLLQKLKASGIKVVLLSPPPVDTTYLFQRHDRHAFRELPNVKLDSARRIVAELAREHRAEYVDIFKVFEGSISTDSGSSTLILNEMNSGRKDGVHPTREGYYRIASEVYNVLEQKKLLRKKRKIICFGDSITYGAFMVGAGTAQGDTYPAFLSDMLLKK
jgi:lysophospholipase L1-like esterase